MGIIGSRRVSDFSFDVSMGLKSQGNPGSGPETGGNPAGLMYEF
jgi:hypothetical protein